MSRLDAVGRMVRWVVAEFNMTNQDLEAEYWTVYKDGSSTTGVRVVSVILLSPKKDVLKYEV